MLIYLYALLAMPQNTTITVDVTRQKPISPYVYGANGGYESKDNLWVPFPLCRQGGNRMTAYNWETNASNAGSDWHHQNDNYLGVSDEPGWTVRKFMEPVQAHGAAVILTVPCAGYVAADKRGDGDVNQTPNYIETRFKVSLPKKPGKLALKPDPSDKFVYQDEFVAWVEKIKSSKSPVLYSLDNEPDLWAATHQRIWPKKPTYAQILQIDTDYAAAIKGVAPKAMILGAANYGWQGFRKFQDASDANGRDFLDFYLAGMHEAEKKAGKRLLDVLDIHWYPEARGDGVRICEGADKPGTPKARIQATRSLWDPTYVEESWIADSLGKKPIVLLPGILAQIAKHYPGTKLAITEYNYGGGRVISGAIAQADVLGLFGRYGLYTACNWGVNPKDIAMVAGYRAFLDYDGKGSKFGDLGLDVNGERADSNAVYAALDSKDKKRLTLVVINKTGEASPMNIVVGSFKGTQAKAYVVTDRADFKAAETSVSLTGDRVAFNAPGFSVTTIEVKR